MNGHRLKTLAWVSAVYDLLLALPCWSRPGRWRRSSARLRRCPSSTRSSTGSSRSPGRGYVWAAAAPEERRGYFWVAGVLAKGLGATLFVVDHFLRGSPRFLLFAATDGTLALVTLALLLRRRD